MLSSLFSPTIKTSPSFLAFVRYVTCPLCKISKQPLVKTIFCLFRFCLFVFISLHIRLISLCVFILLGIRILFLYASISLRVALCAPIFATTTPAAIFANSTLFLISQPFAKPYPKDAKTVSPAPVTSNTSTAFVSYW